MKITDARFYHFSGACLALSAVVLGAFGAHALAEILDATNSKPVWETAVRYQMWHALALFIVPFLKLSRSRLHLTCLFWLIGSFLFSGSLYILSLGGPKIFGPITPIGGLCLIIGWGTLTTALLKNEQTV